MPVPALSLCLCLSWHSGSSSWPWVPILPRWPNINQLLGFGLNEFDFIQKCDQNSYQLATRQIMGWTQHFLFSLMPWASVPFLQILSGALLMDSCHIYLFYVTLRPAHRRLLPPALG